MLEIALLRREAQHAPFAPPQKTPQIGKSRGSRMFRGTTHPCRDCERGAFNHDELKRRRGSRWSRSPRNSA